MRAAPLILALVASLSLAACARKAEEAAQEAAVAAASGGKVEMDKDGDKTTIKTAEGSITMSTEAGQALPADFPGDAFLPSGYKITAVIETPAARQLQLDVPGAMADIGKAVSEGMQAQSWKQSMSTQNDQMHMLMFEKDGRAAQYVVSPGADAGHAVVQLSVIAKQP